MIRFSFTELDYYFHFQPMVTPMSYLLLFFLSLPPSEVSYSTLHHLSSFPSVLAATAIPLPLLSLQYLLPHSVKPYLILPQCVLQGWLAKFFWFLPGITRWNLQLHSGTSSILDNPRVSFARVLVIHSHHHLHTRVLTSKVASTSQSSVTIIAKSR